MEDEPSLQRYEIGIKGLSCINCVNNLKSSLSEIQDIKDLAISFIQERMLITITKAETLDQIKEVINSLEYEITNIRNISESNSETSRLLKINLLQNNPKIIQVLTTIWKQLNLSNKVQIIKDLVVIEYNPLHTRGEHIIERLKEHNIMFTIQNFEYMNNGPSDIKAEFKLRDLAITLLTTIYLTIVSFILPEYVDQIFEKYPTTWGIFSIYLIVNLVLTTVVFFMYAKKFIHKAIVTYVKTKNTNMMTLVALGTIAAYVFSWVYIIWGIYYQVNDYQYFEMERGNYILHASHMLQTATTIIASVIVGKYLESKAKQQIFKEIRGLKPRMEVIGKDTQLFIPKNKFYDELEIRKINPIFIEKGDLIRPEPGLLCFDTILVKGEIKVIDNVQFGREDIEIKSTGDILRSGSEIISSNDAVLLVENSIEKSILSKVYSEVMESSMKQGEDIDYQKKLDKITKYFVNFVIIIMLITFGVWYTLIQTGYQNGEHEHGQMHWTFAVERALSVLVVSCPCALGMAIPIVYSTSLNLALANHILVKDGSYFSKIKALNAILFDKTGTLTSKYNIIAKEKLNNLFADAAIWDIIKTIEQKYLNHPIGQTLYQEALKILESLPIKSKVKHRVYVQNQENIKSFPAEGLVCDSLFIDNIKHSILLGNSKLLEKYRVKNIERIETEKITELSQTIPIETINSYSRTWLCIDNLPVLLIFIDNENSIRANSKELIAVIKKKHKKDMYLVTGDLRDCALQTGLLLGIPEERIKYEQEPHMKEEFIKELQKNQKKVLMIGDGLNDLKAYQAADISVAINYKTSKNLSAAQVILLNNDLMGLLVLFKLAKWSELIKKTNLIISFSYNIFAIPLAAGILYPSFGFELSPDIACWAMAFSSLLVIFVTMLMKCINFKKEKMYSQEFMDKELKKNSHANPNANVNRIADSNKKHIVIPISETKIQKNSTHPSEFEFPEMVSVNLD